VPACNRYNVLVGNTPGVLTETTADLTIALMLAVARRLPEAITAARLGEWKDWTLEWMIGVDLYSSTVGIIGLGRIAQAVVRRLQGFNCKILYWSPKENEEAKKLNIKYVDFDTLLSESDFISVHCPLNEKTKHLINSETLSKMKKGSILINTSRGEIVDQEALYKALTSGKGGIIAAGLDVTTPEPLPMTHPLFTLPNVVILPHIGSASIATRTKMVMLAVHNLLAGINDQAIPHQVKVVNKSKL